MSLGDAGKKRREQIKSLRSAKTKLLRTKDLSMKGRATTAENQVQEQDTQEQDTQEQILKRATRISIYDRYVR